MRNRIILRSGLTGTSEPLHERYGTLESFKAWDETWGIALRLGFADAETAWAENPIIASSVKPEDLCVIEGDRQLYADEQERLDYLRMALRAECISSDELHELQNLVHAIEPGDVELLEAAGVPEFPDHND